MPRNRSQGQKPESRRLEPKFKPFAFVFCFLFSVFCFLLMVCCAQEEFVYDAKGKRDPFMPLVTPDGRMLKLESEDNSKAVILLEGIIYDKNGLSYAIVNGAIVGISDSVGDYQVLKIEEDKVTFIKEGQTTEVRLKKEGP